MHKGCAIAAVILVGALQGCAQAPPRKEGPSMHSITVKFDYDFGRTPACTDKIKKRCIQQFVVYDISAGEASPSQLFTVPVPPDANGLVSGITGTSPKLSIASGSRRLGVVAHEPDGKESRPGSCTIWISVP
jgi:hypothetical protein